MDVTNFKITLKELGKIEDTSERLFFLRDLEKSFKALPLAQQQEIRSAHEQYAELLMIETEKFLADRTLTEFPKELELLLQL